MRSQRSQRSAPQHSTNGNYSSRIAKAASGRPNVSLPRAEDESDDSFYDTADTVSIKNPAAAPEDLFTLLFSLRCKTRFRLSLDMLLQIPINPMLRAPTCNIQQDAVNSKKPKQITWDPSQDCMLALP